jgi:hypothetical protein
VSAEFVTGELLSSGRTGVIVTIPDMLTAVQADDLRCQLEERFPGVTFAVVSRCSGVATFTFDDEAPS